MCRGTLWIASELFFPELTSTGFYISHIAKGLAARGEDVHVLCGQPSYAARGVRKPKDEVWNGVTVQRCWSTTFPRNSLALRLVNAITITVSLAWKATRHLQRGDRLLMVTNPFIMPYLLAPICRMKGVKLFLLVHDVYPDQMVATRVAYSESLVVQLIHGMNRALYRSVDEVIVIGRDMAEVVSQKRDGRMDGIHVIPNWAELGDISPEEPHDNALRTELGLGDEVVFQYAGNMGHPHGVEVLCEAARILVDRDDIRFLFMGSGIKREFVDDFVKRHDLGNLLLVAARPREEQQVFLNAGNVALVSLVEGMYGLGVPSRIYNIMAAGKPMIAAVHPGSEVARLIEEHGIGWVVRAGGVSDLADACVAAASDPAALEEMGVRARNVALEHFSFDRVLDQYHRVLGTGECSGS